METRTISELLDYLSVDSASMGYLQGSVRDKLFDNNEKGDNGDWNHEDLVLSIEADGLHNPIHIGLAEDIGPCYRVDPLGHEGEMTMGNGHHRLWALIFEFHLPFTTEVPVTFDKDNSGYDDDELVRADEY